jgi:hypothetical protein
MIKSFKLGVVQLKINGCFLRKIFKKCERGRKGDLD